MSGLLLDFRRISRRLLFRLRQHNRIVLVFFFFLCQHFFQIGFFVFQLILRSLKFGLFFFQLILQRGNLLHRLLILGQKLSVIFINFFHILGLIEHIADIQGFRKKLQVGNISLLIHELDSDFHGLILFILNRYRRIIIRLRLRDLLFFFLNGLFYQINICQKTYHFRVQFFDFAPDIGLGALVIGYLLIDIAELFLVFFPLLLYFGNSRGIDRFHRCRNERQNHCRTRKSHELFFHLCKFACHLMTMPFSQPAVFQAPKRYALFAFL